MQNQLPYKEYSLRSTNQNPLWNDAD